MNTDNLIKKFADVGLKLVISKEPISIGFSRDSRNEDVFQMDIRRKKSSDPGSEYFVIWPGHEDNIAVVQGFDKGFSQLVLMVKEPVREFEDTISPAIVKVHQKSDGKDWLKKMLSANRLSMRDVVVSEGSKLVIRRKTTDNKRHFLLGRDERQLFMCPVNGRCTTVKQAHDSLRTPTVDMFEGRASGKTYRQGEWFFVNLSQTEKDEINRRIKAHDIVVRKKMILGAGGKPHTADEGCVVRLSAPGIGKDSSGNIRDVRNSNTIPAGVNMYVRGGVRHTDHKTIKFKDWRRVIKNAEGEASRSLGGTWID